MKDEKTAQQEGDMAQAIRDPREWIAKAEGELKALMKKIEHNRGRLETMEERDAEAEKIIAVINSVLIRESVERIGKMIEGKEEGKPEPVGISEEK